MSNPRIALALICGDGVENELPKCLDSFAPWVDGIFIAFNGDGQMLTRTREHHEALWPNVPLTIRRFKWEDDFAMARNQSFGMVPKDEYDFVMWADHDDLLVNGEKLKEMLIGLPDNAQAVFLKYEYMYDFENDVALVEQWRERVMRTGREWTWKYPIHEVAHTRPGVALARRSEVWIRHRRQTGDRSQEVRARNRRILVKARKEDPEEPRYTYYLANEIYAEAHTEEDEEKKENLFRSAILMYTEFIDTSRWDDDTYIANSNMADCLRSVGEYNRAIDVDLQGIKLHPAWPNAYVGICKSCMALADWPKMIFWATIAIEHTSQPETSQVFETPNAGFLPYLLRGIANEEMGKDGQAEKDYQRALEHAPHEDSVRARLEGLRKARDERLWTIPAPMQPPTRLRLVGPQKGSLAFLTRGLFEPWHPKLEAQFGAGGAETCIMRLAPRFAAAGWDVSVFGTPGPHEGIDENGVKWMTNTLFDPDSPYDVLISSRVPEVFDAELAARRQFLWCHDVNLGRDFRFGPWGDRFAHLDGIVGLSQWHIQHMSRLYEIPLDHFVVVPNGIETHMFPAEYKKEPQRFIWTSSPDRGLDVALSLWPEVRKRWPEAELDVFYGFDAIDKIIASGTPSSQHLMRFRAGILELLEELGGEEGGVRMHGRVPQAQLYQEMAKANIWYYPTYFLETYCISAVETQMAGILPVSTYAGALPEVVARKELLVTGWPNNASYQKLYLAKLEQMVEAPEAQQEQWRQDGMEFALTQSWDHAFERWSELIER
jgi:glycosyltransferase involved in cell wall biosynthesis